MSCPELDAPVYPEMGIWFNPEQSGTGFMLEVQNGHLGGFYYLYDAQGNPVWYILTGWLEASDEPGVLWVLETDLELHQGGACLHCEYRPPELGASPGRIRLEFTHRNLARFSVDGAPMQNIVPMTHGVMASRPFVPVTDYIVPDLEGDWVLVVSAPEAVGSGGRAAGDAIVVNITQASVDTDAPEVRAKFRLTGSYVDQDPPLLWTMSCLANETHGPVCELKTDTEDRVWTIRLADLGHRRFVGVLTQPEALRGSSMLQAHRLDFD